MAGLICSMTALGGMFNFPIGGLFAACLSLASLDLALESEVRQSPDGSTEIKSFAQRAVSVAIPFSILTIISAFSVTGFYGQIGKIGYFDANSIPNGVFAGLRTDSSNTSFILNLTDAIEKERNCGNRLGAQEAKSVKEEDFLARIAVLCRDLNDGD